MRRTIGRLFSVKKFGDASARMMHSATNARRTPLASQRLIRVVERDRALWPYAAYRLALATLVTVQMSRGE